MNLFVYGTLKDKKFIQSLLKRPLDNPGVAIMPECTTAISQQGYFVMIPDQDSSVKGVVWQGLTIQDLVILDQYEGCHVEEPIYQREKRKIIIESKIEEVWAYFATPMFLSQIRR